MNETAKYLMQVDSDIVIIDNSQGVMILDFGDRKEIKDEKIKGIISNLFSVGCYEIGKIRNTIYFAIWRKFLSFEFEAGIAFLSEETGELSIQFIVKEEQLSVLGWYYYEKDYNEWRTAPPGY